MSEQKPEYSRVRRKRQSSKANKMLNWMIAIVVLLIVLVGVKIITGGNAPEDNQAAVAENSSDENTVLDEQNDQDGSDPDTAKDGKEENADKQDEGSDPSEGTVKDESEGDEKDGEDKKDEIQEGSVTYSASEDAVVEETMTNTSWEPIGTSQTGNHVSLYDGSSADWKEKQKALAYATGVPENDLIFWKIKNGGSPQKSIGIVSTKDKSKKYRVYLEWVDGEGWKPTQMDILNTLDFNY